MSLTRVRPAHASLPHRRLAPRVAGRAAPPARARRPRRAFLHHPPRACSSCAQAARLVSAQVRAQSCARACTRCMCTRAPAHTYTHAHTHTHTHTHTQTHTLAHSNTPGLMLRSKASEAEAARACADMSEASEAAKQLRQRTHVVLAGLPAGSGTATAAASCGAAAAAGPAASGSGDGALGGGGAARKAMLEDEQRVLGQACSAHAADRLRQVRALRGLPRPARSVLPAPRYLRAHSGSTT